MDHPDHTRHARSNQVAAALIVLLLVQVALAAVISDRAADGAREKAEVKATTLAEEVEKLSVRLALDTCRNTNPSRAFLQLRSGELDAGLLGKDTFTIKNTARVFAIANCDASVRQAVPVYLTEDVEARYLRLFEDEFVPITRGNRIVNQVPFSVYYAGIADDTGGQPAPVPPAGE